MDSSHANHKRRKQDGPNIWGINNPSDLKDASANSFRFHISFKALARKLVFEVLKRINIPKEWVDSLDGNARVLYEILYLPYMEHEDQGRRKELISVPLLYWIVLSCYDENYGELSDWGLAQIIQNRDKFKFLPNRVNPDCWYQDTTGRRVIWTSEANKYTMLNTVKSNDWINIVPEINERYQCVPFENEDGKTIFYIFDYTRAKPAVEGKLYPLLFKSDNYDQIKHFMIWGRPYEEEVGGKKRPN